MKNTLLVLLAVCFLALISQVDFTQLTNNHITGNQANNAPVLDSYFSQLSSVHFDASGAKTAQLKTPKITKWQGVDSLTVQQPKLITWNKHSAWQVTADTASANTDNNDILFQQHVRLEQQAANTTESLSLTTESLLINQRTLNASSNSPVSLNHQTGITHANGLTANFKTGQLQLQGKVSSYYQPEKRPPDSLK